MSLIPLCAALAGCYAQVEDTDVAYLQADICGTPSICAGNNAPLTSSARFVPPLILDLGDSGLLASSGSRRGPITFKGGLVLKQTVVTMTAPEGGNFSGLRTVDLRAAIGNDNCVQLSTSCKSLATYDFARDGVAQRRLVLKGSGVNLLEIAGPSRMLWVWARATGNAPAAPSWNADLELDLAISSRGTFP